MKKLGYDMRGTIGKLRGFGRFAFRLLSALCTRKPPFEIIGFIDGDHEQDPKFAAITCPIVKITRPSSPGKSNVRANQEWEQDLIIRGLRDYGIDGYYSPNSVVPLAWRGIRMVQVHDLAFEINPEWFEEENLRHVSHFFRASAEASDRVFADSQSTYDDILSHWQIPPAKCEVLYPGLDWEPASSDSTQAGIPQKYGISSPYILNVGVIQPRKNIAGLVEAYQLFKDSTRSPAVLALCGPVGWRSEKIMETIRGCRYPIIVTGYVPEDHLAALYAAADLFVYPSHYEGFGFPVLEAMASGVACVVSDTSSLSEICGEAAWLVSPNDHRGIAEAMARLVRDDELRAEYIEKGRKNVLRFRWDQAANQFIAGAESIIMQAASLPATISSKRTPAVNIVCDGQWVTGSLAQAIQRSADSFQIRIVDNPKSVDTSPADLIHLLIWTLWKPQYGDNFVLSVHHMDETYSGYDLDRFRKVLDMARCVVVPCSPTKAFLVERMNFDPEKILTIPYGLAIERLEASRSLRRSFGISDDRFVIGSFSSMHQRKGVDFLIEAFLQGRRLHPEWLLLLITGRKDGQSEEIQRRAREAAEKYPNAIKIIDLNLVSGPNFHQWPRLYHTIDLYCSPSFVEGGPFPVLEAMAAGVPVVSTLTGMVKDFFDGSNLIPILPGDRENILEGLVKGQEQRTGLALRGRITVQRYREQNYGAAHAALYDQILKMTRSDESLATMAGEENSRVSAQVEAKGPAISVSQDRPTIIIVANLSFNCLGKEPALFLPANDQQRYLDVILDNLQSVAGETVFAIPDTAENEPLYQYLRQKGRMVFRGHHSDLIKRIIAAAACRKTSLYIRINADSIFYTADLLSEAAQWHMAERADYTLINHLPPGMFIEVFSQRALDLMEQETSYNPLTIRPMNILEECPRVVSRRLLLAALFDVARSNALFKWHVLNDQSREEVQAFLAHAGTQFQSFTDLAFRIDRFRMDAIERRFLKVEKRRYSFNHRKQGVTNILFINPVAEMGGAEFSLLHLIEGLDRSRFRPVAVLPEKGSLSERLRALDVPVFFKPFMVPDPENLLPYLMNAREQLYFLEDQRIGLIHSNSLKTAAFSSTLSMLTGIPSLCHVRDYIKSTRVAEKFCLQGNSVVVAVSDFIRQNILNTLAIYEERVCRVYNGTPRPDIHGVRVSPLRRRLGIPQDQFIIGFVGMTYPWKGVHLLIDACKPLVRNNPKVRLLIIGEAKINKAYTNYYENLKLDVQRSGLGDQIIFAGHLDDKREIYTSLDLLCQPSIEPDPLPRSVIEAMSYGVCVVGARIGGIPEEIGCDDLLFKPNDEDDLYEKLLHLAENPAQVRAYGKRMRSRARELFSIEDHVANITRLYESLMNPASQKLGGGARRKRQPKRNSI